MRLVTFDTGGPARAGLAVHAYIADLEKAARAAGGDRLPANVRALIAEGPRAWRSAGKLARATEKLAKAVAKGTERRPAWLIPEDRVHLGAPVPDAQKIICIGQNYLAHIREQERLGAKVETPAEPIFFTKFTTTLTGPYDPIPLPPTAVTSKVDYEVELAVVIGRPTKAVSQAEALSHVAGYMVMNDVSARDCQHRDKQWCRAKSFDGFGPCGPWLLDAASVPDPQALKLWTVVNGVKLQDGTTADMISSVARIIEHVSAGITLLPGDIISTGTPPGVGMFRDPQVLLGPGDVVECGVEGVGTLCNTCERAGE